MRYVAGRQGAAFDPGDTTGAASPIADNAETTRAAQRRILRGKLPPPQTGARSR